MNEFLGLNWNRVQRGLISGSQSASVIHLSTTTLYACLYLHWIPLDLKLFKITFKDLILRYSFLRLIGVFVKDKWFGGSKNSGAVKHERERERKTRRRRRRRPSEEEGENRLWENNEQKRRWGSITMKICLSWTNHKLLRKIFNGFNLICESSNLVVLLLTYIPTSVKVEINNELLRVLVFA